MSRGWVSIHRKIIEWEWYTDPNTMRVFLHLLLTSNHAEKKWKGNLVKRGQKITSYGSLADELNLSVQNVRTSLNKLKSTGEITIKTTNKYTLVTVNNYDLYQSNDGEVTSKLTNNQQTTNKQLTTNNNDNNENNENNNTMGLKTPKDKNKPKGLKDVLEEKTKQLEENKDKPKTGITKSWQEKAFRFADELGIELTDKNHVKSRWLKLFKDAEENIFLNRKIQSAYGYLIDYPPFQKLTDSEHKMKYFLSRIYGEQK